MKFINDYHVPALLKEAIDQLKVVCGKKYIDATLGGGGHSAEIIKRGGELLAIDCDLDAVANAQKRFDLACPIPVGVDRDKISPPKVVYGNFTDIDQIAIDKGFYKVSGILFDLGVSSHQLEEAGRGFSFNQEGPLDMRMDRRLSVTAEDLINVLGEKELNELFTKLGEEKFSRRIARAVCRARGIKKIETCKQLAEIILRAVPPKGKFDRTHPATRVFQALRIAVNDELNNLRIALPKAVNLLEKGGRLVVLSFHPLEDGIVKKFLEEEETKGLMKSINSKPIVPGEEELTINPRARSAKLRSAERL